MARALCTIIIGLRDARDACPHTAAAPDLAGQIPLAAPRTGDRRPCAPASPRLATVRYRRRIRRPAAVITRCGRSSRLSTTPLPHPPGFPRAPVLPHRPEAGPASPDGRRRGAAPARARGARPPSRAGARRRRRGRRSAPRFPVIEKRQPLAPSMAGQAPGARLPCRGRRIPRCQAACSPGRPRIQIRSSW